MNAMDSTSRNGAQPVRSLKVLLVLRSIVDFRYLGDIVICERSRAVFPDISVEDGIRIFLTGGMALPPKVRLKSAFCPAKPGASEDIACDR